MVPTRGSPHLSHGEQRTTDFQRLFREHYRTILHFFQHRGFHRDLCADLTQETFLRVYKGMGGFRHEASVKTWLFAIASHVGSNTLRNGWAIKRRSFSVPLDEAIEAEHPDSSPHQTPRRTALDELIDRERVGIVEAALEKLPAPMRNCILMYVDQELTYREIATALQISEETVKSRMHEARQRLRTMLHKDLDVRDDR